MISLQFGNRVNKLFRELSICFKSAQLDHPERNIKSTKTKH